MPALVRQNAVGTATPYTITAAASGNTLVLFVSSQRSPAARTVSSIATTNVTWTKLAGVANGVIDGEIWYGTVAGGSSGTSITLTMSGTGATLALMALEFSGVLVSGTIKDGSGVTNTGTSVTASTGAYSTAASGEVVLSCAAYADGTAPSANPGGIWSNATFANNSTVCAVQGAYNFWGPQGAVSASWTITSAAWATCVGALKAALPPPTTWHPEIQRPRFDKVGVAPY